MEIATDDLLYDAATRTFYGVMLLSQPRAGFMVRNKNSGNEMPFWYAGNIGECWVYNRLAPDNVFKLMLYRDKATMVEQWMMVRGG